MFRQQIPISESIENSHKPVVLNSIRKVLEYFDYLTPDTKIFHNGENETVKLLGSIAGDKKGSDSNTVMNFDNKFFVISETNETEFNTNYGNSLFSNGNIPFWYDNENNVKIRPVTNGTELSIDINAHFNTRQDAINFVNDINLKTTRMGGSVVFSTKLHYPLNPAIFRFVTEVYKLVKEDEKELNFADYFKRCSLSPYTFITNVAGNNGTLVFTKNITDTCVTLNEPTIQKAKVNSGRPGRYEVSFGYKFHWNDVTHWEIEYPFLINQKPLPQEYIPTLKNQYYEPITVYGFTDLMLLDRTEARTRNERTPYVVLSPSYDYYRVSPPDKCSLEIQTLLLLDRDKLKLSHLKHEYKLLNIKENIHLDLGDTLYPFVWKEKYLNLILENKNRMFKPYDFFFRIVIMSGDTPVLPEQLKLTDKGSVYLKRTPNYKEEHRFLLYSNYDFKNYSNDLINWIVDNKETANDILGDMLPWITLPDFEYLNKSEIKDILDKLGNVNYPQNRFLNGMMMMSLVSCNNEIYSDLISGD